VRIQLEVSETVHQKIKDLCTKSNSTTMAEVIRRALAVYEAALNATGDGEKILIKSKDGTVKELVIY
jgi:hypothetical protein